MQTDWSRGRLPLDHSITIKYNEERRAHARRTHALVAQWIECLTPNEKAAGSIPAGRTKMTYPADCQASAPAEALEGHLRSTPTTGESKTKPKWLRTSRLRNCPDDCRARSAMAESWKFLYAVRLRSASRQAKLEQLRTSRSLKAPIRCLFSCFQTGGSDGGRDLPL